LERVISDALLQPVIFRDIAQEAISFCHESLEVAAQRITAKDERLGPIDSKLFLIRHLLVLKDLADGIKVSLGDVQADAPQHGTHFLFAS
jgi:conserved oligomeric Golgi complex subunit 3